MKKNKLVCSRVALSRVIKDAALKASAADNKEKECAW
jgi:hypothetical protein